MKKKGTIYLLLLTAFCLLLFTHQTYALSPGSTGATFLKLGVGSRPVAMGEAYAGVSGDINALYWNPAGMASIQDMQVSFVHNEWFQSIRYDYLAFCKPALGGVVGANITYLWVDGIEKRGYADANGATIEGYVPARDLAVGLSYGTKGTSNLDFGATLKVLYQQLDTNSAIGFAVDLGFQLHRNDEKSSTIGVMIQNLGWESAFVREASPLPLNIKAGISEKYLPDESLPDESLSDKSDRYRMTLLLDGNYGIVDNVWSINVGCEYRMHPVFAIRGGYKYNNATFSLGALSGITCGVGVCLDTLSIDYAFVPYGDLGSTHRISLFARF